VRPVDRLLLGYIIFATLVIIARGVLSEPGNWWLIVVHALIALLLLLFTRLGSDERLGSVIHDLYPLALLPVFYTSLGIMSLHSGVLETFARDAVVQRWEEAIFGGQPSYDWIRQSPSVFWSTTLHLAYALYYPIILSGPILLVTLQRRDEARRVLLATMIAFVACYVVFALYPVAGPNYAFQHPTGTVREVWSARFVYWLLDRGSSFGTAFPSSHVAATVATLVALWYNWRRLAYVVLIPTILLIIATVYCQMHYAIDAALGILVGVPAGVLGGRAERRDGGTAE
jgi:membrane-associated phospholipid phosphatase